MEGVGEGEQGVLRGVYTEQGREGSYGNGNKAEDSQDAFGFFQKRIQRLVAFVRTALGQGQLVVV